MIVVLYRDNLHVSYLVRTPAKKPGHDVLALPVSALLQVPRLQSGPMCRDQGISKAGNTKARTTMIELAWMCEKCRGQKKPLDRKGLI
jgi:hypothetical protein